MNNQSWIRCEISLPPNGVVVRTKIDDKDGERNDQSLKRRDNLWFLPDDSMYVYYRPTHWQSITT